MRSLHVPALFLLLPLLVLPEAAQGQASDQAKIREATAAAPAHISAEAEVQDWDGRVLRAGANDWVCFPSIPDTPGNDAMCLDEQWLGWVDGWVNREPVRATQVGFGYMLCGDSPASNVDPYAEGPTPDNEWMDEGIPHLMIIVPDASMLRGLSHDPHTGGPWVMWRDTPYVHVMVPMPRNPAC